MASVHEQTPIVPLIGPPHEATGGLSAPQQLRPASSKTIDCFVREGVSSCAFVVELRHCGADTIEGVDKGSDDLSGCRLVRQKCRELQIRNRHDTELDDRAPTTKHRRHLVGLLVPHHLSDHLGLYDTNQRSG